MLSLTQVVLQEGHAIQWNRVTQGMLKERQQYQRPVAWAQVRSYLYYLHIWNIVVEQRTIRISLKLNRKFLISKKPILANIFEGSHGQNFDIVGMYYFWRFS